MNYQMGIKRKDYNYIYSNRGMGLESDINSTNDYYLAQGLAVIYKKPTPITINKVDYKSRNDAVIKEAHFKVPSTTDYNGVYKGKYIDFEAKETKSKTSFPLSNIHSHQIDHLKNITTHGGIGFLIVRFFSLNQTYFLSCKKLFDFINTEKRKSIPVEYFKKYGYLIKEGLRPRLDYLKVIDKELGDINEKYYK